jgi:hypothetical protein
VSLGRRSALHLPLTELRSSYSESPLIDEFAPIPSYLDLPLPLHPFFIRDLKSMHQLQDLSSSWRLKKLSKSSTSTTIRHLLLPPLDINYFFILANASLVRSVQFHTVVVFTLVMPSSSEFLSARCFIQLNLLAIQHQPVPATRLVRVETAGVKARLTWCYAGGRMQDRPASSGSMRSRSCQIGMRGGTLGSSPE